MVDRILLVSHPERADVARVAQEFILACRNREIEVVLEPEESSGSQLVLVLGGDGTILAGARQAWELDVPLLGINFGHLGFLAENSGEAISSIVERIKNNRYDVDLRMTLDIEVQKPDGEIATDWALNEAVVLRVDAAHPANLAFAVDGQNVSTYGADGIILATPTGSTAYSFSAGGPVVWPDVEAIVMAPLAAHGLFTRPLVVGPSSLLEVGILQDNRTSPQVWMDGLNAIEAPAGSVVRVRSGRKPLQFARLEAKPFSERLVTKFSLPVSGWRGQ